MARLFQWGGGGQFPFSNYFYLPSLRGEEGGGGVGTLCYVLGKGGYNVLGIGGSTHSDHLQSSNHIDAGLPCSRLGLDNHVQPDLALRDGGQLYGTGPDKSSFPKSKFV
jgi:hypothetical protein